MWSYHMQKIFFSFPAHFIIVVRNLSTFHIDLKLKTLLQTKYFETHVNLYANCDEKGRKNWTNFSSSIQWFADVNIIMCRWLSVTYCERLLLQRSYFAVWILRCVRNVYGYPWSINKWWTIKRRKIVVCDVEG